MRASIRDIAYALPKRELTNEDLNREHPDWDIRIIEARAGVHTRYVAAPDETALDLAGHACAELLARHDGLRDHLGAVIFCTQSPDYIMPPNSCVLHRHLELGDGVLCYDFTLACSGYVYGLAMAHAFIAAGMLENILLVTADTYSRYIHPGDRSARVLFGDGAAVTWVAASADDAASGLIDVACATSGKDFDKFIVPAGGCRLPRDATTAEEHTDSSGNVRTQEHIQMNGLGVLTFASSRIPPHVRGLLKRNALSIDDMDVVVFHQASKMAIDTLSKLLGIPPEKTHGNLWEVGNLVSASIPVAIKHGEERGRIRRGDRLLLVGFGVGLSYASAIIDY